MHGMYSRNGHNQPAAQAHTYSYTAIWSSSTYLRVKQFPIFHVLLCHIAVVGKVKSPNQSVIKGRVQEVVTIRWPPYGVVFEQNLLWKQKIFSASKKLSEQYDDAVENHGGAESDVQKEGDGVEVYNG